MGAHALGAAAYAAQAAGLAAPERPGTLQDEIRWPLRCMSSATRAALRQLPPLGENRAARWAPDYSRPGFSGRSSAIQAGLAEPALPE
jgi:hypothetical protein